MFKFLFRQRFVGAIAEDGQDIGLGEFLFIDFLLDWRGHLRLFPFGGFGVVGLGSPVLDKEVYESLFIEAFGPLHRGLVLLIRDFDLGPLLQQVFGHILFAMLNSVVKRGLAIVVN